MFVFSERGGDPHVPQCHRDDEEPPGEWVNVFFIVWMSCVLSSALWCSLSGGFLIGCSVNSSRFSPLQSELCFTFSSEFEGCCIIMFIRIVYYLLLICFIALTKTWKCFCVVCVSNCGATCGQHHPVQQSGQCDPVLQTGHQDGAALPDALHRSVSSVFRQ